MLPVSVKAETDSLAKALYEYHKDYYDHLDSIADGIRKSVKKIEALAKADLKRAAFLGFLKT